MAEMLKTQYESVASKPKEEFKVKFAEKFFFSTSPVKEIVECQQCKEEVTYHCSEDKEFQDDEDEDCLEVATSEDWRELLEGHIQRIEDSINENNHADQDKNESQDDLENTGQHHEEINFLTCDWLDVGNAIDSIPGRAAPGPDGIPASLLKRAKKPMSRMICKLEKYQKG